MMFAARSNKSRGKFHVKNFSLLKKILTICSSYRIIAVVELP